MDKERVIKLLNSDLRYLFLVSMISADTNVLEEDIRKNIEKLETLRDFLKDDDFVSRIKDADDVKIVVEGGIETLHRDLNNEM